MNESKEGKKNRELENYQAEISKYSDEELATTYCEFKKEIAKKLVYDFKMVLLIN